MDEREWTVVLPVKVLAVAKSRLADGAADPGALALAFFTDALAALTQASTVSEIVVATADPTVAAAARVAGAVVVDDTGQPGINAAAQWAARQRTGRGGVAVMVSDLPCLTPDAVETVLALAGAHSTSFVPDLDGTGTTMWIDTTGEDVSPRFGPDSRAEHTRAGAADLSVAHPEKADAILRARCDVDTEQALGHAMKLGVGAATRALLAS